MERIGDILQSLARQRGRNDSSPLILWQPIAPSDGARVSHVPISQHLSHAWIKLTGDPFRPHQSLALTTLRRGDAIALSGASVAGAATARLLLFELLRAEPDTTALIVLPDLQVAHDQIASLQPLNAELGNRLTIATVGPGGNALHAAHARVILTTPAVIHGRLLRYHDRIWQRFWRGLRAVWIDDAHTYAGVAAAHLGALLLRGARLRHGRNDALQLIATLGEVADAETTLQTLWPTSWRRVLVDDVPTPATTLAVWRGGSERLRDAATLAQAFGRAGYRTHLVCAPLDQLALRQLVGEENDQLSSGTSMRSAQIQLLVGYPGSSTLVRSALASGAEATVVVLGDQPCDAMLSRLPATLLNQPPPAWPVPIGNGYVTLQHLVCAANERPLALPEIDQWQVQPLIARMVGGGQLVALPGSVPAWQPHALPTETAPVDPYAGFALTTTGGLPTSLVDDSGQLLDQLDATAFDRWGYPGAVLPPGGCRYRVASRDEARATLGLRPEVGGRRTHPLRRGDVTVLDEQEQRTVRGGRSLGRGRVHVHEEIHGYREVKPGSPPAERTLSPPLSATWSSYAMWIDVGITPATNGQVVGWSLVHALPLRAIGRFTDVVPLYDVATRRLFLVDAQPGGNGLSSWVYGHLEELLPLAYDIALDCRNDALLEPMARADMDWLLLLLGGEGQRAPAHERPAIHAVDQPAALPDEVFVSSPAARVAVPTPRREPPAAASPESPASAVPSPLPTQPPAPAAKKGKGRNASDSRRSRQTTSAQRDAKAQRDPAPKDASSSRNAPSVPPSVPPDDDPLPPLPAAPTAAPAPAALPNANAMIARMRQLRQQREQHEPQPARQQSQQRTGDVEPRFHAGDAIVCQPYGQGRVIASRIEDESEILEVEFPDYGALIIDPAVSLVRLIEVTSPDEDDLL